MDGEENFLTSFAAFAYGSDAEGKILLDGNGPIWESDSGAVWVESAVAYDTDNPAGYWMVNTGNPTRDAIATIAMNELGFDNFKRAAENFRDGNYLTVAREAAFGIAELGLGLTGIGKLAQSTVRAPKAFKAARAVAGQRRLASGRMTANQPGGFLNRARTAVFGGRYVDPAGPMGRTRTIFRNGQRIQRPGGPIVQQRPNAFSLVAQRYRDQGLIRGVIGGTVRSTAKALSSGLRAAFPKGKRAGRLGLLAYPATIAAIGLSRLAGEDEVAEAAETATDSDGVFENFNIELAEATARTESNAAGIQQQYNNIFKELQGMYNLAETEEEKERLRFMLADIEAQRDAGLTALEEGYAKTVGDINARAVKSREETKQRAQQSSQELAAIRDRSRERMIAQQAAQVAGARGLGTAAGVSPENEWIDLMSQYPETQQRYIQRMGDITAEGIDWLADTTAAQGLAQRGDLQRLAASTRAAVVANQQQQVADRIAREQAEMRDAMLRLSMAGVAASQQSTQPAIDDLALREQIASLGAINYPDVAIRNYFEPILGRRLTPSELKVGEFERSQYAARQAAQAANTPVVTGP